MTHLDIWKAVCRAIEEVSAYSPDEHARYMESATLLPPMIPIGDGRHVLTTQAGVEALAKLGEAWRAAPSKVITSGIWSYTVFCSLSLTTTPQNSPALPMDLWHIAKRPNPPEQVWAAFLRTLPVIMQDD